MASTAAQNYISLDALRNCGYAMIAVVSSFAITRISVRITRPKALAVEDALVFLSYLCFLVQTILYLKIAATVYKVSDVISGKVQPYAGLEADAMQIIRVFFANTLLFWCTLWLVKGSLLSLYRRLLGSKKVYRTLWWVAVIFCIVVSVSRAMFRAILIPLQTFIGAVVSHLTSCSSISAWFTVGACATPRDSKAQIISLYYAFAVDVISDLIIMALPIGLVWNLKMSRTKKAGIVALFCVGLVAIATAIVRVVSIGVRAKDSTPSSTWLAFWGIIETGIAVIIGTAPGLYTTARKAHTSKKESRYAAYHHGYHKHTGDLSTKNSGPVVRSSPLNATSMDSIDDDERAINRHPAGFDTIKSFSRPSYLRPKTKAAQRASDETVELRPRNEWDSSNLFFDKQFTAAIREDAK